MMKLTKYIFIVSAARLARTGAALISTIYIVWGCAQYVPPSGGKRDKTPPKLINTIPKNQSTEFKGQNIELEFDEYVVVENLNQQLLITPELEGGYTFKPKPKGVVLDINKPLKENVTYTFNFRNAIKDFSERNPARNIKLVFSTGKQIDSLSVGGEVKDLETNTSLLDAVVGLYRWSDTATVAKLKPYYFTRTDSAGKFKIENIQAGKYRLFALVDLNNNLLYENNKEKIGFEKKEINLQTSNLDGLQLNVVLAKREKIKQQVTRPMVNYYDVEYSRGVEKIKVTFDKVNDSIPYMMVNEKLLRFFNTRSVEDTLRAKAEVVDSLGQVLTQELKVKFRPRNNKKEEGNREKLNIEPEPKVGEEVGKEAEWVFRFNKPISKINIGNIRLLADTTKPVAIEANDLKWNQFKNELTIKKKIAAQRQIRVLFEKGAFMSIENDSSQVFKNDYPIKKEENYGIIGGTINNAKGAFVVQLIEMPSRKVISEIFNKAKYQFDFVKAGNYTIRVIDDTNSNGRWDFGNPERFELPERIIYLAGELKLKQNFELTGNDLDLK